MIQSITFWSAHPLLPPPAAEFCASQELAKLSLKEVNTCYASSSEYALKLHVTQRDVNIHRKSSFYES